MIIILEGPDGGGKTVLAHQLAEHFQLEYHHEGPPPQNVSALDHYGALLNNARHDRIVFDRLALGERVYGPVMRNLDRLGEEGWRIFKRLIRASGAIEVLCLPQYKTCYSTWSSGRLELFNEIEKFQAIYTRYYELRDDQFIYNFEEPDAFTRLCHIIQNVYASTIPLPRPYIGSPEGRYLFVGDVGSNARAIADLPFWATVGSSKYLNEAIDRAGFKEEEFAMVNAYSHDGPNKILGFERIIALGRRAEMTCLNAGLQNMFVPHPQFWKRFNHHDMDSYVELLKECRQ